MTETATAAQVAGQLEVLAADLSGRGFATSILTDHQYPCVKVVNESATQLFEHVYAAPAADGSWWFWWSWKDPITRITDIEVAALRIAYVLMRDGA